jgi:hypothetical protein
MRTWAIAACLAALAACSPPAGAEKADASAPPPAAAPVRNVTVTAPIVRIEDSGYPRYIVHVAAPEGVLALDLNVEEVAMGGLLANELAGKTASIDYRIEPENNLTDLRLDGRSLIDGTAAPTGPSITGILSGAASVTAGDVPDAIAVADAAGRRESFAYFVTPALVAANGREVTAFFKREEAKRVTALRLP